MKFKILIKFLYLVVLLAYASYESEEKETQLIDSDPTASEELLTQA